jgi:cytochrome b561
MRASYDRTAVLLHWGIGAAVLGQLALGWWMLDIPKGPDGVRAWWFNLHKSIGMALGLLILLRAGWRITHAAPALPLPGWQRSAAAASHAGLYACMLVMPLSGYLGSSFSKYPIRVFGAALPHWGWDWPAAKQLLAAVHETAAWAFSVLLCLHIAAALWHALRADGIFRRMWI